MRRPLPRWAVPALCIALALACWLSGRLDPPGLTWDEAYYYPTFLDVRAWCALLLESPGRALSAEGIRAGWERISELPPAVKWLGALSLSPEPSGPATLAWMRVVPAMLFAGTLLLVASVARRLGGPVAAVAAVLLYALHPHVWGHAQFAATETPFAFVNMLALRAALDVPRGRRARVLLVLAVGLALATKVNALVLCVAVVSWLVASRAFARGRLARPLPGAVPALLGLAAAPVVAFAIWPWMWAEPVAHAEGYARFIAEHSHQGLWFLGRKWNFDGPLAPVWAPAVLFLATAPLAWLAAVIAGLGAVTLRWLRRRRIRSGELLLALAALGPLAASSLPGSPKYDGVRLFVPMYAPLCVLAAVGVARAMRYGRCGPDGRDGRGGIARWALAAVAAVAALTVAERAVSDTGSRRPLSFYNLAVEAASRSARAFPFERTYWCEAIDGDVIAYLNRELPPGARVRPMALQTDIFPILQKWGVLRADLVFGAPPPYDAHLLQNRRGLWGRSETWIAEQRVPLKSWYALRDGREPLVILADGRPPGQ
jgi:hypothetical protein